MSPPITTQLPSFGFDCASNSKISQSFDFSAGSADAKSNLSSRSKPRLTKVRRKQTAAAQNGESLKKTDLGLNGSSDGGGEIRFDGKFGGVVGGNDGISQPNGVSKIEGLNGNNDSLFGVGLGNEKFVFGVCESESRGFKIKPKVNVLNKSDNAEFVFGSDTYEAGSRATFNEHDSSESCLQSSVDEFQRVNGASFVFGACKNVSADIGNTVPDVRGKVKLDTSGDSEKVRDRCSQFPFNRRDDSSENSLNFVFGSNSDDSKVGIGLGNKPTGKNKDMSNSTDSCKDNAEIGIQFQDACLNRVFVFGGLKGNGGKVDDCNGFGQHNHKTPDINSKFQHKCSSGSFFEKGPEFSLLNEMRKLNIGASKEDGKKTEGFTSNFSVNSNNMFVFESDQKNPGIKKENHPVNVSRLSENKSEPSGGFCGVPSVNKDEKDGLSFASKPAGLDSSNAACSTPNTTFTFSNYNFFPGVDKKMDSANSKSLGGKRLKKRNGKLKQRTVVQQLFGQDRVSEESMQNQKSPGYGSPMDFSPYQEKNDCSAPEAITSNGVKGEFAVNEKDRSEHCEKTHDNEDNSNPSSSLPSQDGLSALRNQYKKKYKLKVGSNHTVECKNSNKENTKQDAVPTAAHEVCEHWRIRGNQAYHDGKLSKAEEFYSMGIDFASHDSTPGYSTKPLLLCYSNRAATRMSLGRMREALGDCRKAAELDPNFLKVTLRAGNCNLLLGEVEDARQCYSKCLSLGTGVCLDRRITIEAADGLQKAEKVAEYMNQSAKLLQEKTDNSVSNALAKIEEALSVSWFSERLLRMKGEALCSLRMYNEVIHLCEQTVDVAKKNSGVDHIDDSRSSDVNLWRWHLQAKSHFHLGRLDLALDLIEKQEQMSSSSRSGDVTGESLIALAASIRELQCLKKSGNEAFSSGRYTEAIENYTAAISKSFETRPFMAICFCNRAAAYQSINQIVDAIADCSLAIAVDENYQKAISRRATLHEMIRDYKQAVYDLQRLISLLESQSRNRTQQIDSQSRSNGASVRDLRKARRRLSSVEEKAKKETPLDLYLILGIKPSDAESEIKKAYRKAALRHHPDKVLVRSDVGDYGTLWKDFGEKIHEDSDRLFKIIGEAYAVLSDSSKRSKYDSDEEMRNIYKDSNRNSNSGCASTSYSSPYERGTWFGRQASSSTSSERNNRRYWHEPRSYSHSHSRW